MELTDFNTDLLDEALLMEEDEEDLEEDGEGVGDLDDEDDTVMDMGDEDEEEEDDEEDDLLPNPEEEDAEPDFPDHAVGEDEM